MRVHACRIDAHGNLATANEAEVTLHTDPAGRCKALNPVGLLLSSRAACMLKTIERVTAPLHVQLEGAAVWLEAMRTLIRYETILDSPETDQRLDLLHRHVL